MPHLTIEYARVVEQGADMPALLRDLHAAIVATGLFPLAGIRVRAFCADHCIVADGLDENGFVALTLAVGTGRSRDDLEAAGARIFAAAQDALADLLAGTHFALSMEIREIDPQLSWKDTPIHKRLSAGKETGAR